VTDSLRFRGGFNRATRAPNLGEMFLPLQQIFTGAGVYGDPCGVLSNSPFGAGGAIPNPVPGSGGPSAIANGQTAAGAQSAYLICRAQMGTTGSNFFYTNAQPGAGGGGFAWVNQIGNANLDSEVADTWTAGVVIQSPFESAWLRGFTATIDWYQIAIDQAILPYSIDYARFLCYGAVPVTTAAEAAVQAATTSCTNLPRNPVNGGGLTTLVSYDNQATIKTAGVDFSFTWASQLEDIGLSSIPGGVMLNVQGTVLDYYETKQSPASYDPVVDWKGTLGPNLQGFNSGAYSWRLFTSLSYNLPTFGVSLRWRHLPSVEVAARAQQDAVIRNNEAVVAGGSGTRLSYTPITNVAADAYDVFDLSGYWTINDTLSLRVGIDNLFDKDPVITGQTTGYPKGTDIAAVCAGAPGCVNPGTYSLPNSGQGLTSGGYYDVLGRRYYVGLKARF
jgi:outer membrane receptor protein involved in Fe transport